MGCVPFPQSHGHGDFGVGSSARLCFSYCTVQMRSLAVLRGSGGDVLNKINSCTCLCSKARVCHVSGFSFTPESLSCAALEP